MSQLDTYLIFQDMFLCMLFTKWTLSSNMYIPFDNRASQLCSTFTSQNGDRTSGSDESKSLKTWIILAVLWTRLAKGLLWEWAKYIISVTVFLAPSGVQDPQTFASESFVLSSCPWLALLWGQTSGNTAEPPSGAPSYSGFLFLWYVNICICLVQRHCFQGRNGEEPLLQYHYWATW